MLARELRVWKAPDGMWWLRCAEEWFEFDAEFRCVDYCTVRDPETRIPWARAIVRAVCSDS